MYYKLIREQAQDKAVVGTLYAISHYYNKRTGEYVEKRTRVCATLENSDYLVPALIYRQGSGFTAERSPSTAEDAYSSAGRWSKSSPLSGSLSKRTIER